MSDEQLQLIDDLGQRLLRLESGAASKQDSRKSTDGWGWRLALTFLFSGLFLVAYHVAIDLKWIVVNKPPSGDAAAQYQNLLTVVIPIFIGFIAYMASATGAKRLEKYDEEFERFRGDRYRFEKDSRDEIARLSAAIRDDISARTESILERTKDNAESTIRTTAEQINADIQRRFEGTTAELNGFDKKYGPYIKTIEKAIGVVSVGEIHGVCTKLFGSKKTADITEAKQTVIALLDSQRDPDPIKRMRGSPDDWFNLSAVLGRNDQEYLSYRVCLGGLKQHRDHGMPDPETTLLRPEDARRLNQDLLAHAIDSASKTGELSDARMLAENAEQIGRREWGWRLFVFVGGYYRYLGNEEYFLALHRDYATVHPYDERAYSSVIQYFEKKGRLEEARDHALGWRALHQQTNIAARSPQMQMQLAEIEQQLGNYDAAYSAALAALEASTEDQPGANQAAMLFIAALALDAKLMLILRSDAQSPRQSKEALRLYESSMTLYKSAAKFDTEPLRNRQGKVRTEIMQSLMRAAGLLKISPDPDEDEQGVGSIGKAQASQLVANQIIELLNRIEPDDKTSNTVIAATASKVKELDDAELISGALEALRKQAADPDTKTLLKDLIRQFLTHFAN